MRQSQLSAFPLYFVRTAIAAFVASLLAIATFAQSKENNAATPKPHRPQEEAIEAAPPLYDEEIVAFDNLSAAGVRLTGTLTLPKGAGPFPAVLLIAGSGRNDRDESIKNSDGTLSGHRPMFVLADALTRQGYAVLRYDKRGVGKSSGDYGAATMMDSVSDARAAIVYLRSRRDIDGTRLVLIGHSEGGTISGVLAADDPTIACVVMMAPFAEPGRLLVAEQNQRNAIASGKPPAEAAQTYALNLKLYDAIAASKDQPDAEMHVVKILSAANPAPDEAEVHEALLFARLPMMRFILAYDPVPALARVRVPVLALGGTKDLIGLPDVNLPALRKALAEDADVTIVMMPGLNHFFQHADTGLSSEMPKIEETMAPEVLAAIIPWLKNHTEAGQAMGSLR